VIDSHGVTLGEIIRSPCAKCMFSVKRSYELEKPFAAFCPPRTVTIEEDNVKGCVVTRRGVEMGSKDGQETMYGRGKGRLLRGVTTMLRGKLQRMMRQKGGPREL